MQFLTFLVPVSDYRGLITAPRLLVFSGLCDHYKDWTKCEEKAESVWPQSGNDFCGRRCVVSELRPIFYADCARSTSAAKKNSKCVNSFGSGLALFGLASITIGFSQSKIKSVQEDPKKWLRTGQVCYF